MRANLKVLDKKVWIFFGYFLDCGRIPTKQRSMMKGNSKQTNELYQFGGFRLDATERRLWRDDEPLQLTDRKSVV